MPVPRDHIGTPALLQKSGSCTRDECKYRQIDLQSVQRGSPQVRLPLPLWEQEGARDKDKAQGNSRSSSPIDKSKEQMTPLSIPIYVSQLEMYLESITITSLCSNKLYSYLKTGADIGYRGSRFVRFFITFSNRFNTVWNCYRRICFFGRVAGPFFTPPFSNLQVSPTELVPKKYSTKFERHFTYPFSSLELQASITQSQK